MGIAALVVWAVTAGAGAYLLTHVIAAKRAEAAGRGVDRTEEREARNERRAPSADAQKRPAGSRAGGAQNNAAPTAPPSTTRVPLADRLAATPPPIPRVKVKAGRDDHPLREFSHPALGLIGVASWLAFVDVHYRPFGWIAAGVLAATVAVGLHWLAGNLRTARCGGTRTGVPMHLVVVHGLAAATTVVLVAVTLIATAR